MLPEKIGTSWQTSSTLIPPEQEDEKCTHQCVEHLGTVALVLAVFPIDLIDAGANFRIVAGFKIEVCRSVLAAECLSEKGGHKTVLGKLIPENLLEGAGTDGKIQKNLIVFIAGSCVDNRRCNGQNRAGVYGNDLVLKIYRTGTGYGIENGKIVIGVPVSGEITEHSAYGNVVTVLNLILFRGETGNMKR